MNKMLRVLVVALTALALAACGGASTPPTAVPPFVPVATVAPLPTTTKAPPTATPAPTAAPSLEAFEAALTQALVWRSQAQLAPLMGDPFSIGLWQSEGVALAPADAAARIVGNYLPSSASPAFEKLSPEQMEIVLSGSGPSTIWGADVKVADIIFSRGWGQSTPLIAFLAVAQRADGQLYWHGVLFADASTPMPTSAPPTVAPTAAPTQVSLAITSFACQVESIATGKRLTFTWTTTGATGAEILCAHSIRFPVVRQVAANGTTTIDLGDTYYPNPTMTLTASDGQGHTVKKDIKADWPCRYGYFFPNGPGCPAVDPTTSQAAGQAFENGRMVWLKEIVGSSSTLANQIVVLYDDGEWAQFDDTWQEGEPEVDTSITAPAGLQQPKRGFGKLWRTNVDVRNKLGWAKVEEQGYTATWQWKMCESLPSVAYLRTIDNQVVELSGQHFGGWRVMP